MFSKFEDRTDAGRQLAGSIGPYDAPVVLGLARGGLPVAREVADALEAPLDVVLVQKIGAPNQPEYAVGAVAPDGVRIDNTDAIVELGLDEATLERLAARELEELERREASYRDGRPPVPLEGRTVILVDDGLATGTSMRAAIEYVERQSPAAVVVAVPIGAIDTCEELRREVDELVCLQTPSFFFAVAQGYMNFSQTTDAEVRRILREARR
jgi:predicted phosphoribosyltransferase